MGNGGSTGSHGHIIKALCDEIRDRYGFEAQNKEDKTDEKALEELFNRVAAEGDKSLLIVLDAINQIIDIDNSKQLNWLPIPPKKVKILFTTLEDDRTMEVFRNRHYPVFTLQPLTKTQREDMVRGYLSIFSKKLQPYQVERIVDDKQCENTLVLKTLLDELVNFGIFEKLDEKIGTYLGTSSVEEFYGILLKGYEVDFGESFVKHILSLIAVSRNGLSEEELLAITNETPLHWSQFFCAIRQHLVVKNGLISFAHSYIRKAVEDRYLQGQEDWSNACRKVIVSFFNNAKTHRAMDELPYQYDQLGDLEKLHDYLMDLEVFSYLKKNERTNLGRYWQRLKESNYSVEEYLSQVDTLPEDRRAKALSELSAFTRSIVVDPRLSLTFIENALPFVKDEASRAYVLSSIGLSYGLSGNHQKALEFEGKALKIRLSIFGENHRSVASSFNSIGTTYGDLGNHKDALEYEERALKIRLSLFGENHPSVANSYNSIGITCGFLGDYKKALEYDEKALKIRLSLYGGTHPVVANSYNNVGGLYGEIGDYNKSLEYQEMALKISLSLFGENHPSVATYYNNVGCTYGDLGYHPMALIYQKKALKIRLSLFGEGHPDVANSYNSVGFTYGELGEKQKALEYQERALKIRLSLFGENHPSVATSCNNVGLDYGELGDYKKALEYEEKALKIQLSFYGENHSDVADSYSSIGYNYGELGDAQMAIEYQKKALKIWVSLYGENHINVAQSYDEIGREYGYLDDYANALEYRKKALSVWLLLEGDNREDIVRLYNMVGIEYSRLEDHKNALEYRQKALSVRLSIYGELHPDVARSYDAVGREYGKLGDPIKAIESRKKALDIAIRISDFNLAATLYNRVGNAYKAAGQQEKANEYFRQAAERFRELGDEEQAEANLKEIIE